MSSIHAALKTSGQITLDELVIDENGGNMIKGMSADGQIIVEVASSVPQPASSSQIKVEFIDTVGN